MADYNTTPQSGNAGEGAQMSFRDMLDFAWRLRYWIVLCAFLALVAGFCYVRMQNPVYKRSSWVMLNNESTGGGELSILADLTGQGVKKRIDNEIFILQTPTMMAKVVEELNLNTRYYHYEMPVYDRLRIARSLFAIKRVEYYQDNPFQLVVTPDPLFPEEEKPYYLNIVFKNIDGKEFVIKELKMGPEILKLQQTKYRYGETIALAGCSFSITVTNQEDMIAKDKYVCSWSTPFYAARGFIKNLTAEIQGQKARPSDVVMMSLTDTKAKRADDILNTLIIKVNNESREYGNITTLNTINFIDQRLATIAEDLGAVESDYKKYQSDNIVVDLSLQSQAAIGSDRQYQEQLTEVKLQLQVLDMISGYIGGSGQGSYDVIPANIGISDAGLNNIIADYNSLVAERNRMISNSSETNPRVVSLNSQLADMRKSIEVTVANLVRVYTIKRKDLDRTISLGKNQMTNIPQQQFELQQLNRKLEVIEPLYQLLQQKREEAQIQMYSQMDNFRVIETSFGEARPISPKSRQIYLLFLILGCAIPVLVVWLRMQLRTKVETKKDVTDKIDSNVIAVLPKAPALRSTITEANYSSRLYMNVSFDYYRSDDFTDLFLRRIGEQRVFIEHGIPAVLFTSGITMNTNKVDDTPRTLNYEVLRKRALLISRWLSLQ